LIGPLWRRIWARIEGRVAPIEARIQQLEARLGPVEARLAPLEGRLEPLEARVAPLEARLEPVEARLAPLEARLDPLEARVAPLEARLAPLEARLEPLEARLKPLEARLAPLEGRLAPLEARLGPLEAGLAPLEIGWREHLPAFLNAVSTVGHFGHELLQTKVGLHEAIQHAAAELEARLAPLAERLGPLEARIGSFESEVRARVEFVRREILFALSNGGNAQAVPAAGVPPRVRSPEKLAEINACGLRLNLGCGHIPLERYVNVDRRDLPGVDIIADPGDIPLPAGSVREIFSVHMLQHFPQEELRRRLLHYWRDLLAEGGQFRAVVPDGAAMLAGLAARSYPFADFREVLFGVQDCGGDLNYNLFTPQSLTVLLEEAGFKAIEVPFTGRRNGKCFEFEIVGFKR
jgi:uncharacterized protein YceH (UPF0502 family)